MRDSEKKKHAEELVKLGNERARYKYVLGIALRKLGMKDSEKTLLMEKVRVGYVQQVENEIMSLPNRGIK